MKKEVKRWDEYGKIFRSIFASNPGLDEESAFISNYLEQKQLIMMFKKLGKPMKFKNTLDIGAGTGRLSLFFSEFSDEVFAIEPAESLFFILKKSSEGKNITTAKKDIQSFKTSKTFDLIIISGVLTLFNDQEAMKTIKNINKLLSKNGIVILRDFLSKKNFISEFYYMRTIKKWYEMFNHSNLVIKMKCPARRPMILLNLSKKIGLPIHKPFYKLKCLYSPPNPIPAVAYWFMRKSTIYFFVIERK